MKNKEDFIDDRNADLYACYKAHLTSAVYPIRISEILKKIAVSPAKRFYISEGRAAKVISRIERGLPVSGLTVKKEMYMEIHRRAKALSRHRGIPMYVAIREVIYEPAPSFYLTEASVKTIFYDIVKKNRLCKKTKWPYQPSL